MARARGAEGQASLWWSQAPTTQGLGLPAWLSLRGARPSLALCLSGPVAPMSPFCSRLWPLRPRQACSGSRKNWTGRQPSWNARSGSYRTLWPAYMVREAGGPWAAGLGGQCPRLLVPGAASPLRSSRSSQNGAGPGESGRVGVQACTVILVGVAYFCAPSRP